MKAWMTVVISFSVTETPTDPATPCPPPPNVPAIASAPAPATMSDVSVADRARWPPTSIPTPLPLALLSTMYASVVPSREL